MTAGRLQLLLALMVGACLLAGNRWSEDDQPQVVDVRRDAPATPPRLLGATDGPAPDSPAAEPVRAPVPTRRAPTEPTVVRFRLPTPKGWIDHPKIGVRLIVSSNPAWYSYDAALWQGGGSLRDEYPSQDYPSLEGAVCLMTLVGHIRTGAQGWNIEAFLCVNGVEVKDLGVGGTSANIIGFTGGPPAIRWNVPVDGELLGLLADAVHVEVRFRTRRLTRDEELTNRKPIRLNGKRLTVREYVRMQRPPKTVEFTEEVLETLRSLR